MTRIYKSKTSISINVVLKSNKSVHIAFASQSDGSSVYSTGNAEIQEAIERHCKFGKLFKLYREYNEEEEKAAESADKVRKENERPKMQVVKVSDLAAARDYLADTFGISRTYLRGEKSITESAREHNIQFEGI